MQMIVIMKVLPPKQVWHAYLGDKKIKTQQKMDMKDNAQKYI